MNGTTSKENAGSCSLPASRIRTIMKSSPEVNSIGNDSLYLIVKATELFVEWLARQAYQRSDNADLLDYKHLADIVNDEDKLKFLHDIIPKKIKYKDYLQMVQKGDIIVIQ